LSDLVAGLVPDEPEVLGLAALIRLTDARRVARLDGDGMLTLLEDQDRNLWDRDQISAGLGLLRSAHETEHDIGPYVLQAGAAAVHALAPRFAETDWCAILEIYNRLAIEAGTLVVLLNRAIALSYVHGPQAGIAELDALAATARLDDYHYLHSARAELLRRLGQPDQALVSYNEARRCCENAAEIRFLDHRIAALS
jgi:RNA polymerase sigma-70 factor, ECF subfamily